VTVGVGVLTDAGWLIADEDIGDHPGRWLFQE
jgi:hypothetical protein